MRLHCRAVCPAQRVHALALRAVLLHPTAIARGICTQVGALRQGSVCHAGGRRPVRCCPGAGANASVDWPQPRFNQGLNVRV